MSPAIMAKSLPVMPNVEPPLSVYLVKSASRTQGIVPSLTGRSRVVCYQLPQCCVELERRSSLDLKPDLDLCRVLTPYWIDLRLLKVQVSSGPEEIGDGGNSESEKESYDSW